MGRLSSARGNKPRRGFQRAGIAAKYCKRRLRLRNQMLKAVACCGGSEHADERRLVCRCILAGGFADHCRVALDVEKIVGDLESLSQCRAVTVESIPPVLIGLAEDGSGQAAETQERTGLHGLQHPDVLLCKLRRLFLEAALRREIEHLPADHPAESRRSCQCAHQLEANFHVGMGLGPGENVEGEGEQRVAREYGGCFVECLVCCRTTSSQVVVVHRRQIVMRQRVAMHAFQRRPRHQRMRMRYTEQRGALNHEKGPQTLAAAEARMAHGVDQPRGAHPLAFNRRRRQQAIEQGLRIMGDLPKPPLEGCLAIYVVQGERSLSATIPKPVP